MDLKTAQILEFLNNRLSNIENHVEQIKEKLDFSLALQRNHLIHIKNSSNQMKNGVSLISTPYNDLTPAQAYEAYNSKTQDFILLDVSSEDFEPKVSLKGRFHIPLEQLGTWYTQIQSKTIPILVISENGLKSIQACELLIRKGFFNVNNISGGYQFWPNKKENLQTLS